MNTATITYDHSAPQETRPSETATVLRILLTVLCFIGAWGAAIVTWGLPGLFLPAVALVPVAFVMLLVITRG